MAFGSCRFKSCLRHLYSKGLTANNAVSPCALTAEFSAIFPPAGHLQGVSATRRRSTWLASAKKATATHCTFRFQGRTLLFRPRQDARSPGQGQRAPRWTKPSPLSSAAASACPRALPWKTSWPLAEKFRGFRQAGDGHGPPAVRQLSGHPFQRHHRGKLAGHSPDPPQPVRRNRRRTLPHAGADPARFAGPR